jgi:hypothetical protein
MGRRLIALTILFFSTGWAVQAPGSPTNEDTVQTGIEASLPGIYFYRLEPSFYTGFAPRCQYPERIHIHLGRGNQLRVTVVLSDPIIVNYLPDLAYRYRIYTQLIEHGTLTLTQNTGFENFRAIIIKEKILDLAGLEQEMGPAAFRKLSLEMLEKLNPGRVFHIQIDFEQRMHEWAPLLNPYLGKKPSMAECLDLINQMLPTRMTLSELFGTLRTKLNRAITLYAVYEEGQRKKIFWDKFYAAAVDLFETATGGIYPPKGTDLDFYEFTAIYPVGTANAFTQHEGQSIPQYPYPGKRPLTHHQRTRMVDHIPDIPCYGYLPWIPYMHVGERLHNSFHTLWFNIDTRTNGFIPEEWKNNTRDSRTGRPYPHLWLLSRGPMSHGCTHVNAGHISELRQMLPSSEALLGKVVTFRNRSDQFDVFDIDGDGRLEVMGVKYFYAYSLKGKKPRQMRAPSDRESFYKWLYRKGFYYSPDKTAVFERAFSSKFIGKRAVRGKAYKDIPLYEAEYTPETIQFYKLVSIPFARELRRVSDTYPLDHGALKLAQK